MDIPPRSIGLVGTGLVIAVPDGYFLGIFARSSTPLKRGLMVANGVGVVDADYCGPDDEVKMQVINMTARRCRSPPAIASPQGDGARRAAPGSAGAADWRPRLARRLRQHRPLSGDGPDVTALVALLTLAVPTGSAARTSGVDLAAGLDLESMAVLVDVHRAVRCAAAGHTARAAVGLRRHVGRIRRQSSGAPHPVRRPGRARRAVITIGFLPRPGQRATCRRPGAAGGASAGGLHGWTARPGNRGRRTLLAA